VPKAQTINRGSKIDLLMISIWNAFSSGPLGLSLEFPRSCRIQFAIAISRFAIGRPDQEQLTLEVFASCCFQEATFWASLFEGSLSIHPMSRSLRFLSACAKGNNVIVEKNKTNRKTAKVGKNNILFEKPKPMFSLFVRSIKG